MFGMGRGAARRDLRRLVEDDYLRVEGERRWVRYLPGSKL
jgi:DNA-binding GntR family transcriptional regulator